MVTHILQLSGRQLSKKQVIEKLGLISVDLTNNLFFEKRKMAENGAVIDKFYLQVGQFREPENEVIFELSETNPVHKAILDKAAQIGVVVNQL